MENIIGLTYSEVNDRINSGHINEKTKMPSKTAAQIIRSNVFTVFNALNLVLALLVLIAGSPKNALFAGVILTNTLMGIIQELKAKKTLEKLSLLNQSTVEVLRDEKRASISAEEIVLDDVVVLKAGDQISADGFLLSSEPIEVDESSLTGESDSVLKKKGDVLLSGSFIVSGFGCCKVTSVGRDTYISKLSTEAKKFKAVNSELKTAVNKIVKIVIWLLFPIGSTLMASQILYSDKSWNEAVVSSIAGIVGMVPEGLVLLTTVSFLLGVVRLSKWNTLVQDLPATEVLARVDTICLDKTGTLTEGSLLLKDVISLNGEISVDTKEEIAALVHEFKSENATMKAVLNRFTVNPNLSVLEKIPFSSKRKWSGLRLEDETVIALGAPEILLREDHTEAMRTVSRYASEGKRVVLFARGKGSSIEEGIDSGLAPVALLIIEDVVRKEAPEALSYFKDQGVDVKIISGDNPLTVSAIAKDAGVINADMYVDARVLPKDLESLIPFLEKYTVFGRVSPHQKRDLIKALKLMGKTVAMTGDGVNDILALKESDCGIALSSGSESTKSVAQLVLLDSNFANLPKVVSEGRRIINNLERVAGLYLTKTVYSILLSFLFAVTSLPYPFMPIHLTLIGSLVIGIPSFFLALSPNESKVEKDFLYRVLSVTVPKGIVVALCTFGMFLISHLSGLDMNTTRMLTVVIAGGVSLVVLLKVARPLSKAKLGLISAMTALFSLSFAFPIGRMLFSFTVASMKYVAIAGFIILISYFMMDLGMIIFKKAFPYKLKKIY